MKRLAALLAVFALAVPKLAFAAYAGAVSYPYGISATGLPGALSFCQIVNTAPSYTNGFVYGLTCTPAGALRVDGSEVTQPVSGTVSVSGTTTVAGAVSINGSVAVNGTFWQAVQPVSATAWPLPTGASTSALQPGFGTAGTPIGNVTTVQGIMGGYPVAISATSLPLPTGASTAALQPGFGTAGSANVNVTTVQGIAGATPVPITGAVTCSGCGGTSSIFSASFPSAGTAIGLSNGSIMVPFLADGSGYGEVNVELSALPTGAATSALQTTGNASLATLAGTVSAGSVSIVCASGCGGSGGTASTFGATFPATGTAIGAKNGANMVNLTADGSGNLDVNCVTGCSGGGGGGAVTLGAGAVASGAYVSGSILAGAIVDLGTGASPGANTTNGILKAVQAVAGSSASLANAVQGISGGVPVGINAGSGAFASGAIGPGAITDLGTGGSPAAASVNGRLASTQSVAGTPSATQTGVQGVSGGIPVPVSGTVAVTGPLAVTGTFWQATQPVSAASLPLPTGAATSANQTNASQKTQIVDGSGNVIGSTSNFLNVHCDSTCTGGGGGGGAITIAAGAVASGAYLDCAIATLGCQSNTLDTNPANTDTLMAFIKGQVSLLNSAVTAINSSIPAGTNIIGKVDIDQTTPGTTNGVYVTNASPAPPNDVLATATCTATCSTTTNVNSQGAGSVVVVATGSGTGLSFLLRGSLDGTNWTNLGSFLPSGSLLAAGTAATTNGSWVVPAAGWRFIQVDLTAISGGSETFNVNASAGSIQPFLTAIGNGVDLLGVNGVAPPSAGVNGILPVAGGVASGATQSSRPLPGGGTAQTAIPTAVTNGQAVAAAFDTNGSAVTAPYAPKGLQLRGAASATGTGATTIIAAQGAGVKIYVTGLQCGNTGSATTTVTLNDSATSVFVVPASSSSGGGTNVPFETPLAVAANTALTFTAGGSTTTMYCNAQGFAGS